MPSLGLSTAKAGGVVSSYERDGLKLYMPYTSPKEVKFVGKGSAGFDGVNDYINCGVTDIPTGTEARTMMIWVYQDGATGGDEGIFGWGETGGSEADETFEFYNDNTHGIRVHYATNNSGGTTVLSQKVWTHIAATYDGVTTSVYINGVLDHTDAHTCATKADFCRIGANNYESSPGEFFDGSLKNAAIWSRTLSATEVQNVMHKTYINLSGTLLSGLVSWWALDDIHSYHPAISTFTQAEHVIDSHGDNTAVNGWDNGATLNTDLYGGATPLIPRGFDNAPTVQADAIGTGYANFVGSSSNYIHIGDIGETANAICMWFKPTTAVTNSTGGGFLMNLNDSSAYYGIALSAFTGSYTDEVITIVDADGTGMSSYLSASASISTDWHHLAFSYNGTSPNGYWDIYLDGILLPTTESSTVESIDVDHLQFGRRSDGGAYYTGKLKNVGIWTSALTQPQIQSIMEKTYSELIASEKSTLAGWWGLDTNANDEHGSNNGTLT